MRVRVLSRSAAAVFALAVSAGLFGSLAKAAAADQAVPAMRERMCEYGYYNGLYAGVNAGYADHNTRRTDADALLGESATLSADASSATGGVQVGYNWQSHCTVWGIEADWQWSGADAKGDMAPNLPQLTTFTTNMQWFSTLRGRYGVMVDQTLIYGTVGVAFAGIHDNWTVGPPFVAPPFVSAWTNVRVGLAAGGGLEYAWTPTVSLRAEALYLAFSDNSHTITGIPPAVLVNVCQCALIKGSDSAIVARAGINVKLGQWFGH